jgi:hypothetical protein
LPPGHADKEYKSAYHGVKRRRGFESIKPYRLELDILNTKERSPLTGQFDRRSVLIDPQNPAICADQACRQQ